MRLACSALMLAAACGNLSNEDVAFLVAIPQRDQLHVAVPANDGTVQPACLFGAADVWTNAKTSGDGLNAAGWVLSPPRGAIYVWAPTPDGETSGEFADFLLEAAGVVVAPGAGYGRHGEGYVRFSLTLDDARLAEGVGRIARALKER